MAEFYLRKNDPVRPVYEVDFDAGTWRLAASAIGVPDGAGGVLADGGSVFRDPERFERVWLKESGDGLVTFTREDPAHV